MKETVEEYLARGGNINTEKIKSKPSYELIEPIDYPISGRCRLTTEEYYNSLSPSKDYSNLELWQIEELKRCYMSYKHSVNNSKLLILPKVLSKMKFRNLVEKNFPDATWNQTSKIKKWIKSQLLLTEEE